VDLCGPQGPKRGADPKPDTGEYWRVTAIDIDSRLRVARAIAPTEDEAAFAAMAQLKVRFCPEHREAMVATWGTVPDYGGLGRPPELKQPGTDWQYVQVVKERQGNRVTGVSVRVIYGDPKTTLSVLGGHTAYVERTHLTSRQMNARLVRKTLSYSKQLQALSDASAWEDSVYNLVRPLKTLRQACVSGLRRWRRRSPAMAAGLTDHLWTLRELLLTVVVPRNNSM
jgi:hypothetical protein